MTNSTLSFVYLFSPHKFYATNAISQVKKKKSSVSIAWQLRKVLNFTQMLAQLKQQMNLVKKGQNRAVTILLGATTLHSSKGIFSSTNHKWKFYYTAKASESQNSLLVYFITSYEHNMGFQGGAAFCKLEEDQTHPLPHLLGSARGRSDQARLLGKAKYQREVRVCENGPV